MSRELPESKIERIRLVELLKEMGPGDPEHIDQTWIGLLSTWKEQEYANMPTGAIEGAAAQIQHIISEATIFSEAGYPDLAIEKLWDAMNFAEMEGDAEKVEKIKAEIIRINPQQEFPEPI